MIQTERRTNVWKMSHTTSHKTHTKIKTPLRNNEKHIHFLNSPFHPFIRIRLWFYFRLYRTTFDMEIHSNAISLLHKEKWERDKKNNQEQNKNKTHWKFIQIDINTRQKWTHRLSKQQNLVLKSSVLIFLYLSHRFNLHTSFSWLGEKNL